MEYIANEALLGFENIFTNINDFEYIFDGPFFHPHLDIIPNYVSSEQLIKI